MSISGAPCVRSTGLSARLELLGKSDPPPETTDVQSSEIGRKLMEIEHGGIFLNYFLRKLLARSFQEKMGLQSAC